jgi:hypothetical protein
MDTLCKDLTCKICAYLTVSERAMLSITSKQLAEQIARKQSLLSFFIHDQHEIWIVLALSWGCRWTKTLYCQLGYTGNINLFRRFCFSHSFFGDICLLDDEQLFCVYKAAAIVDKVPLLQCIDLNKNVKSIHSDSIGYAAVSGSYKAIEYFLTIAPKTSYRLPEIAVRKLDLNLLAFCRSRNIDCYYALHNLENHRLVRLNPCSRLFGQYGTFSPYTEQELSSFLDECKALNINFMSVSEVETPTIMFVLVAHGLYDYRGLHKGESFKWLLESSGKMDLTNTNWKRFIYTVIELIMNSGKYRIQDYFQFKTFLHKELTKKQYRKIKTEMNKYRIIN